MVLSGLRRAVASAALVASAVVAAASPAVAVTPPTVPANLAVPTGNTVYLVGHARGYQIYVCQPQNGSYAWVLSAPWAGLVGDNGQNVALHYAGPSWQSPDSSIVVGARVASSPVANAIPWLLLSATSTSGPVGSTFKNTTYIQRVNTTGGLAPASGCDAAHANATAAIYYTADYFFYRPSVG